MPDPSKGEVIAQLRGAISSGRWIGLTIEELRAIFTTLLIEAEEKRGR